MDRSAPTAFNAQKTHSITMSMGVSETAIGQATIDQFGRPIVILYVRGAAMALLQVNESNVMCFRGGITLEIVSV